MRTEPTDAVAITPMPPALLALPAPAAEPLQAVILFGRDERGRPHASRFVGDEAADAENAARLMGLHLAHADTDALRNIATRLPAGRLFPSGRGFVPFVKGDLFERLLAAAGLPDMPLPLRAASKPADVPPPAGAGSGGKGSPDAPGGATTRPANAAGIGIGSVVLACQGPMEGWWEAIVKFTKAPDSFVCVWRDFPLDGEFVRARKDLGLLPLDSREGLG